MGQASASISVHCARRRTSPLQCATGCITHATGPVSALHFRNATVIITNGGSQRMKRCFVVSILVVAVALFLGMTSSGLRAANRIRF